MTRRRAIAASGGLAGAALAACGGAGGATGGAQGTGQVPKGPVTIQFLGHGGTLEQQVYQDLLKDFQGKNPTITVDVIWEPGGSAEVAAKITSLLAGGTPPDSFWVHSYSTLDFSAQNVLADLTSFAKEKGFDLGAFYKAPLDDFRWQGQLLAIPRETSTLVMFYNKGQWAQNGVKELTADSTWNDWLEAAKKLTKDDPNGKVFGTYASTSAFNVFQMIWQNGGELMNAQRTQAMLDSPAAIEAAQFIADMRTKSRLSPLASDYTGQTLTQFFMSGRMGSYTTGQSLALELQKNKPFEWDAWPCPRTSRRCTHRRPPGTASPRRASSRRRAGNWSNTWPARTPLRSTPRAGW
jgi:multiple sugar transport system substrate-binding protein